MPSIPSVHRISSNAATITQCTPFSKAQNTHHLRPYSIHCSHHSTVLHLLVLYHYLPYLHMDSVCWIVYCSSTCSFSFITFRLALPCHHSFLSPFLPSYLLALCSCAACVMCWMKAQQSQAPRLLTYTVCSVVSWAVKCCAVVQPLVDCCARCYLLLLSLWFWQRAGGE